MLICVFLTLSEFDYFTNKVTSRGDNDDEKKPSKTRCIKGDACKFVRAGLCKFYHEPCIYGLNCKFLKVRNCKFAHPKDHFIRTEVEYILSDKIRIYSK